jgi:hypothetical protein
LGSVPLRLTARISDPGSYPPQLWKILFLPLDRTFGITTKCTENVHEGKFLFLTKVISRVNLEGYYWIARGSTILEE